MPVGRSVCLPSVLYCDAMASRKQFRAVPIQMGKRYRRQAAVKRHWSIAKLFGAAILGGGVVGIASAAATSESAATTFAQLKPLAVSMGLMRARVPQPGDHWYRCDDARAAGSAPISRGEPGYREGLDGDNDGVACEPYRGMP